MVLMFQCFSMFQKQCNMGKNSIYQTKKPSCPMFQNQKASWMKHQQIDATISQVSMFHMFLYIIAISLKLPQKVFWAAKGVRLFIVVGRQDYTKQHLLAACQGAGAIHG